MFLAYYLTRERGVTTEGAIGHVRRVRPAALSAEGREESARRILNSLW